ncbi:hypothetical protein NDU88_004842 [Pleurodeles waltl]|uniref:Uncharacterized protein n=1 Tax=Pleurodeles waltl TaxID=8319 RepID=A0AAV7RIH2_PLEWA|nr:hypothetical protein NDU88_004842 [Pleurodeles waltl]
MVVYGSRTEIVMKGLQSGLGCARYPPSVTRRHWHEWVGAPYVYARRQAILVQGHHEKHAVPPLSAYCVTCAFLHYSLPFLGEALIHLRSLFTIQSVFSWSSCCCQFVAWEEGNRTTRHPVISTDVQPEPLPPPGQEERYNRQTHFKCWIHMRTP